jgi:hypothetical protein
VKVQRSGHVKAVLKMKLMTKELGLENYVGYKSTTILWQIGQDIGSGEVVQGKARY